MAKCLCEMKSKNVEEHLDEIEKLVKEPEFICIKCIRCAKEKKVLCKPVSFHDDEDDHH